MERKNHLESLLELKNIGPKSAEWLYENGIQTKSDIEDFGAVNLFLLLKDRGHNISKVAIYAFEGAIRDIHWNALPPEVKLQLEEELATSRR